MKQYVNEWPRILSSSFFCFWWAWAHTIDYGPSRTSLTDLASTSILWLFCSNSDSTTWITFSTTATSATVVSSSSSFWIFWWLSFSSETFSASNFSSSSGSVFSSLFWISAISTAPFIFSDSSSWMTTTSCEERDSCLMMISLVLDSSETSWVSWNLASSWDSEDASRVVASLIFASCSFWFWGRN